MQNTSNSLNIQLRYLGISYRSIFMGYVSDIHHRALLAIDL